MYREVKWKTYTGSFTKMYSYKGWQIYWKIDGQMRFFFGRNDRKKENNNEPSTNKQKIAPNPLQSELIKIKTPRSAKVSYEQ